MNLEFLLLLTPHLILTIVTVGILYVGYTLAPWVISRFCPLSRL